MYNKKALVNYYSRLLKCFVELKNYKESEKLIKKRIKRYPNELGLLVDLGSMYSIFEEKTKSKQSYDKAIKQLSPNNQQVINLANTFLKYKETDYALATYLKGRKLLKGAYTFNTELAQVYDSKGDYEAMFGEYLDLLSIDPSYLQHTQNALQTTLSSDEKGNKKSLLKTLLIRKIQKKPDEKVFAEMLIWTYIQENNFNGAFLQAKALDRRLGETGKRIVSLAELSYANKDYKTAINVMNT